MFRLDTKSRRTDDGNDSTRIYRQTYESKG